LCKTSDCSTWTYGDAFWEELISLVYTIQVGSYTETPEPFMGPLISPQAAEKILAVQEELKIKEQFLLIEVRSLKKGSAFLSPGILDVTAVPSRKDEILWPMLQVIRGG